MPASGPTPGSTPTSVPTRQPMNPYQSTPGDSATENPSARFCRVSPTSEPESAARQRHAQHGVEEVERPQTDGERARREDGDGVTPFLPADLAQPFARPAQRRDGDAKEDQEHGQERGHVG